MGHCCADTFLVLQTETVTQPGWQQTEAGLTILPSSLVTVQKDVIQVIPDSSHFRLGQRPLRHKRQKISGHQLWGGYGLLETEFPCRATAKVVTMPGNPSGCSLRASAHARPQLQEWLSHAKTAMAVRHRLPTEASQLDYGNCNSPTHEGSVRDLSESCFSSTIISYQSNQWQPL
jgi:hypothetical protein